MKLWRSRKEALEMPNRSQEREQAEAAYELAPARLNHGYLTVDPLKERRYLSNKLECCALTTVI
jgi:hypothetical protein